MTDILRSAPERTLWITQRPDGKVRAFTQKPPNVSDLFLQITYIGAITDITHGGFFSVPIDTKDESR